MVKVAILTASDSCAADKMQDGSGKALQELISAQSHQLCGYEIVPDDIEQIKATLIKFADDIGADVILTTGGTGLGPRDVTVEATQQIADKLVPGIAEAIRAEGLKHTPNAMLSRGIAVIRGKTLIVNLPGSVKGATQSCNVVIEILSHAKDMLAGGGH